MPTPAGWYPDSTQVNTQRYWDGEHWTDQRAPLPPASQPPAAKRQSKNARHGLRLLALGTLGFIVFLFAQSIIANESSGAAFEVAQFVGSVSALMTLVGVLGGLGNLVVGLLASLKD